MPVLNQATKKPGITKQAKNCKGIKLIDINNSIEIPPIKLAFKLEITNEAELALFWPLLGWAFRRRRGVVTT
jgi:hypothetical protein